MRFFILDYSKLRVIRAHREICIPEELYSLRKEIIKVNNRTCVVVHAEKKYVPYIENVIDNIKKVMEDYNIDVRTLSGTVKPQNSNFQTILKMLKNCIFAIVIFDGLRPNVVLEYGILLSLEKPIIVLKENNAYFNIRGLNTKLKDDLEENHINDPKLDIDSHLSDVKDLHWTLYDWQTPDNFKKTLQKRTCKD